MSAVFVCVECTYPSSLADRCDNPGCLANPTANHAVLREQRDKYLARKAEDDERLAERKRLRKAGFNSGF